MEAFWRTLIKHKRTIDDQLRQHRENRRVAETELDELALAAIGGGLDADEDIDQERSASESMSAEPVDDAATAEAERQTEKATLATLGNTNHPNFAEEMKLLAEMLETAEWARQQPDEKLKKLFQYIDQNMRGAAGTGKASSARWNGHRIPSRITDAKRQELLASAGQDISELQGHLEKKAHDLETTVRKELARAGEKEAENTRKLLVDQDKRIDKTMEDREREEAAARGRARDREAKAGPMLFDNRTIPRSSTMNALVANATRKSGPCSNARKTSSAKSSKSRTESAADTPCRRCG